MYLLPDPLIERVKARFNQPWTKQTGKRSRNPRKDLPPLSAGQTRHYDPPSDPNSLETLVLGPVREPYEIPGHAGTPHRIHDHMDLEDPSVTYGGRF